MKNGEPAVVLTQMVLTYHAPPSEPGLAYNLSPRLVHPASLSLPPLSPIHSPRSVFPDPGAPNPAHLPSRQLPVYPAKPMPSRELALCIPAGPRSPRRAPDDRASPRTLTVASSPRELRSPSASKYSSSGMRVPRQPVWDAPRSPRYSPRSPAPLGRTPMSDASPRGLGGRARPRDWSETLRASPAARSPRPQPAAISLGSARSPGRTSGDDDAATLVSALTDSTAPTLELYTAQTLISALCEDDDETDENTRERRVGERKWDDHFHVLGSRVNVELPRGMRSYFGSKMMPDVPGGDESRTSLGFGGPVSDSDATTLRSDFLSAAGSMIYPA